MIAALRDERGHEEATKMMTQMLETALANCANSTDVGILGGHPSKLGSLLLDLAANLADWQLSRADTKEEGSDDGDLTDPFAGTGIIVVGAGYLEKLDTTEPEQSSKLKVCGYSQGGSGICLIAPSDGDGPRSYPDRPADECGSYEATRSWAVPTADILGPGGYADDPRRFYCHQDQRRGFGGTSAAAAHVAGAIARMMWSSDEAPDPVELRQTLIGLVGPVADIEQKYNQPDLRAGWGQLSLI